MVFSDLVKKSQAIVAENASTILTAGGVVGTVTTAVLTGRASIKAHELIREEELKHIHPEGTTDIIEGDTMGLSNSKKVLLVWPVFVPPVVIGTATICSIIMANQMSAQRAAALAAAYGVSQRQLEELNQLRQCHGM